MREDHRVRGVQKHVRRGHQEKEISHSEEHARRPRLGVAAFLASEDPPSYNVDDRTPFNVVVVSRSAHTATIAWHTEVPTRGVIDYGRAWGFDDNGYTNAYTDDVAKTDHQITLTDLRRWTGYVYRVTAITPLGLRFPEKERKFRTKFWAWR